MLYYALLSIDFYSSMPKYEISDEDKNLFREAMRDVKPLCQTPRADRPEPKPVKPQVIQQLSEPSITPYYLSNYYQETVQADTVLEYCRPGIPTKRLREFKSGQIQYEARLDLHGLTLETASDALCDFIGKQFQLNQRMLLIIHGKGGKHGEAPILKNLVNYWLPQIPTVLAFHSAMPKHGGTGAVSVLLKKQR